MMIRCELEISLLLLLLINNIGVRKELHRRGVAKVEWPAAPSLSPLTSTVLLVAPSWRTLLPLPFSQRPFHLRRPAFSRGFIDRPQSPTPAILPLSIPLKPWMLSYSTLALFLAPLFFLSFFLSFFFSPSLCENFFELPPPAKPSFCPISYHLKWWRLFELILAC